MNEEHYEFQIVKLCGDIDESYLSAIDSKGQYVWSFEADAAQLTRDQAVQLRAMFYYELKQRLEASAGYYDDEFDDDCFGHIVVALRDSSTTQWPERLYAERLEFSSRSARLLKTNVHFYIELYA